MKDRIIDFLLASSGCFAGIQFIPDEPILKGVKYIIGFIVAVAVSILLIKIKEKKGATRKSDTL